MADATPDDFDAAIDEAKAEAEGNLSRANAVRKVKGCSGGRGPRYRQGPPAVPIPALRSSHACSTVELSDPLSGRFRLPTLRARHLTSTPIVCGAQGRTCGYRGSMERQAVFIRRRLAGDALRGSLTSPSYDLGRWHLTSERPSWTNCGRRLGANERHMPWSETPAPRRCAQCAAVAEAP